MSEIIAELKQLVKRSPQLGDSLIPPLVFLLLFYLWGLGTAVLFTGSGVLVLFLVRLWRGQSVRPASGGLLALLAATAISYLLDDETSIFLPGILSSSITFLVALISILWGRPMVAWTSFLARRWPWDWYWHPRVRPAYTEVTWFWALYFLSRLLLQLVFFIRGQAATLSLVNFLLSWPATLLLLIFSYLYGNRRLQRLAGPSVIEYQEGKSPPWESQQRGF